MLWSFGSAWFKLIGKLRLINSVGIIKGNERRVNESSVGNVGQESQTDRQGL